MIDQRLVRDNPVAIARQIGRRGHAVDLTKLQVILQQHRQLEEERSTLQAQGNRIGKEVGLKIKDGADPGGTEIVSLREEGNFIKKKVSVLENEEKILTSQIREQLLTYPNPPSEKCPDGSSEVDNVELRSWGTLRQEQGLEEH